MRVFSKKRTGYTLLEMVMVLGILALSARIMVPKMAGLMNAWDIDIEINKLKSKIRQVQQLAIAKQATYRLTWDIPGQVYTVKMFDGSVYVLQETNGYQNNVSVTATTFIINPGSVDFDQFGAPSEAGMIMLRNNITMMTKYIQIQAVTGQLKIL
jgi:prepilin-type N-terminal cleavage/methylation domain-containing protein